MPNFDEDPTLERHALPTTTLPVWPLPSIDGRHPVAIATTASPCVGVELAYARTERETRRPSSDSATHFMPSAVPALAVYDGVIAYAGWQAGSYFVVIDHENGWATHYTNLESAFAFTTDAPATSNDPVRAGDAIGYVGANALYFELWRRNEEGHYEQVDPRPHLPSWTVMPCVDRGFNPSAAA